MIEIKNYIGGEWVSAQAQIDCMNPATAEIFASVPDSSTTDLQHAVDEAQSAHAMWSESGALERSRVLRKISQLILDRKNELALAETTNTGKPLHVSTNVDIPRASLNFEFFANAITAFQSESHESTHTLNYTSRDPLGVVGCISPWNLPLYLLTWKIAPALAAGNTVIAKPSEVTPMTAFLLSQIVQEAGLPKGVLNIVHGKGDPVGQELCRHPRVKAISFTGSSQTGAMIARDTAPLFKKVSLEMGGKNPNLILADANLDLAIAGTIKAAFSNQGQICLCGSRILVEKKIYSEIKERLLLEIKKLKVGDPLESTTRLGAVTSKAHFEKIISYLELAKKEGGRILAGGSPVTLSGRCKDGWFIAPTLIENLAPECRTNQEEIFGPVATLVPFETDSEALEIANHSRYGLSASIWTESLNRAHFFSKRLQVGMVWINGWMIRDLRTPFGGMKDSGVGREGGMEALRFFTEPKNICFHFGGE